MQIANCKLQNLKMGFTFIEVLVGTALILVVFSGIFGAYQLGLKVVSQSRTRITATTLANQKIEMARNLDYDDVGTIGGIPSGTIPETETIARNNIDYTVKTTVVYIDDPLDGLAPTDTLSNDYKRVKVKVSWAGRFTGKVELITDVAPKGVESEIGGGTLAISVFDASGIGAPQVDLHIVNGQVSPAIDVWYQTDSYGDLVLPGAPASIENYRITASKTGYSTDRTYGTEEVANPSKPHATVFAGQVTSISFSIDRLSTLGVDTQSPESESYWSDSFLDQGKISESNNVLVSEGEARLTKNELGEYLSSGYLISTTISPDPEKLLSWKEFSFTDTELSGTDLKYQILYFDGASWVLIPDADLAGNSIGFDVSPVDISGVPKGKYPEIRLKANFSTLNSSVTPVLYDWTVTWKSSQPKKIANVTFNLKGAKLIGTDADGDPVYKYSQNHTTNQVGHIDIPNLEWDSYSFSVDKATTGLDLISTEPEQPVNLLPNTSQSVILNLRAENTLLVTVKDSVTLNPIFAASVRVYSTAFGYDQTQPTDEIGQAFFIPLEVANYDLEITASGYQDYPGQVSVSGTTTKTVNLTKL